MPNDSYGIYKGQNYVLAFMFSGGHFEVKLKVAASKRGDN